MFSLLQEQLISGLTYTCEFSLASNSSISTGAMAGDKDHEVILFLKSHGGPSHVSSHLSWETVKQM